MGTRKCLSVVLRITILEERANLTFMGVLIIRGSNFENGERCSACENLAVYASGSTPIFGRDSLSFTPSLVSFLTLALPTAKAFILSSKAAYMWKNNNLWVCSFKRNKVSNSLLTKAMPSVPNISIIFTYKIEFHSSVKVVSSTCQLPSNLKAWVYSTLYTV